MNLILPSITGQTEMSQTLGNHPCGTATDTGLSKMEYMSLFSYQE